MKIIHISTSLSNGGLENMMVDIANEQYRIGHHIAIIVVNKNIDKNILNRLDHGIKVFLINRKPGTKSVYCFLKLWFIMKINSYDIIHAHGTYLGKLLKFITRKKIVHTVHAINNAVQPLQCYSRVFAISKAVKNDVESKCSVTPKVIYNGVDISRINNHKKEIDARAFRIVHIGRLIHEKKGQDILLHALNYLVNEKKIPENIRIDFIGKGKSKQYLEELTEKLKLTNIVNFVGNKPREWIYEHLAEYDLFIQPSRFEGFGLTVAEAIAAKVPVIVAHNDGPAEIIADGKYGLMFENGNAFDLAEKVLLFIQLSKKEKIKDMIEAAYQNCLEKFNVKRTALDYIKEYELILNQKTKLFICQE